MRPHARRPRVHVRCRSGGGGGAAAQDSRQPLALEHYCSAGSALGFPISTRDRRRWVSDLRQVLVVRGFEDGEELVDEVVARRGPLLRQVEVADDRWERDASEAVELHQGSEAGDGLGSGESPGVKDPVCAVRIWLTPEGGKDGHLWTGRCCNDERDAHRWSGWRMPGVRDVLEQNTCVAAGVLVTGSLTWSSVIEMPHLAPAMFHAGKKRGMLSTSVPSTSNSAPCSSSSATRWGPTLDIACDRFGRGGHPRLERSRGPIHAPTIEDWDSRLGPLPC